MLCQGRQIFDKRWKFQVLYDLKVRESTVAIWDADSGKLITSSYTLDKINDIKVSPKVF